MKEHIFLENKVRTECGELLTLRYTVLTDDLTVDDSDCTVESYGIRISVAETGEAEECRGITIFSGEFTALLLRLTENTVTPCTLCDVIRDYLSDACRQRLA